MSIHSVSIVLLLLPALAGAAPETAQQLPATPTTAATAEPAPHVLRATFTSGVRDREPVNSILSLGNNEHRIYYFTDLQGLEGQTITHRWLYHGAVVAAVHFKVKGPRWRVWSSKTLLPDQLGQWEVQVLDGSGHPLRESRFEYTQVEPAAVARAEP